MQALFEPRVFLSLIGLLAAGGLGLILFALMRTLRRLPAPQCPRCEYSLVHLLANGRVPLPAACPECGHRTKSTWRLHHRAWPVKTLAAGVLCCLPALLPAKVYWEYRREMAWTERYLANTAGPRPETAMFYGGINTIALDDDGRWNSMGHWLALFPPQWTKPLREARWCTRMSVIWHVESCRSFEPLAELTHVTSLTLPDCQVTDLRPLSGMTRLQNLELNNSPAQDLRPLAALTRLKSLELVGTPASDLRPLASLTRLEYLDLTGASAGDLRPLAALLHLKKLYLTGTPVQDLQPLATLKGLTELSLAQTQGRDLRPLATLTRLEFLSLWMTPADDLAPLAALTRLKALSLEQIPAQDFRPLASLTQLERLNLSKTSIADLQPLEAMTQLQELDLTGTPAGEAGSEADRFQERHPRCNIQTF